MLTYDAISSILAYTSTYTLQLLSEYEANPDNLLTKAVRSNLSLRWRVNVTVTYSSSYNRVLTFKKLCYGYGKDLWHYEALESSEITPKHWKRVNRVTVAMDPVLRSQGSSTPFGIQGEHLRCRKLVLERGLNEATIEESLRLWVFDTLEAYTPFEAICDLLPKLKKQPKKFETNFEPVQFYSSLRECVERGSWKRILECWVEDPGDVKYLEFKEELIGTNEWEIVVARPTREGKALVRFGFWFRCFNFEVAYE
ncbi:hypothetical protein L596_017068 [Steinernema carpocapsae]|uniref:Uncharacterized protein n=1 Tax=Steinernema carpocapsae TaxID=34508 RepID=A0A4U5N0N5_STECR|nr:hypothetical protein L596_017068 [Steinernema carpocapsae]